MLLVSQFAGALLYDHEMAGEGLTDPNSKAGRNAGLQVLPYKVSFAEDGRVNVSTSVLGFKNMNAETKDDHLDMIWNKDGTGGWSFIDDLSILNFEYSKDVAAQIKEKRFSIVSIDTKLGLFSNETNNFYFALKGGATPLMWHDTQLENFVCNGSANQTESFKGFETELRYGAEVSYQGKKGWRFIGAVDFKNRWSYDNN